MKEFMTHLVIVMVFTAGVWKFLDYREEQRTALPGIMLDDSCRPGSICSAAVPASSVICDERFYQYSEAAKLECKWAALYNDALDKTQPRQPTMEEWSKSKMMEY